MADNTQQKIRLIHLKSSQNKICNNRESVMKQNICNVLVDYLPNLCETLGAKVI